MSATKTRKKSKASKKPTTKKPKWSVITYKQIEQRRQELGYSKSAMAEALGVTNSTYHNWRRGTTVPHATQQVSIKATLGSLKAKGTTPKGGATRRKGTAKNASGRGRGGRAPRTDVRTPSNGGGGNSPMHKPYADSHPLYPTDPQSVRGIAQITAAYISAQEKAPSAGSVFKFVRGLRGALADQEG